MSWDLRGSIAATGLRLIPTKVMLIEEGDHYLVHLLDVVEGDVVLDVLGEVLLVLGLVFLGQVLHVLGDVAAVDAVAVHLRLFGVTKAVKNGEQG